VKETFKHLHKSLVALKALDPDLDITDDFLAAVEPEADRVQQEMNALESSITSLRQKLDALWDTQAEYEYELVSVFMHRGRSESDPMDSRN
jgi:ubiquitin carboxyl-terminal hydrolase 25/28